ncbi:MAG: hypothetical protein ACU0DI_02250 [Paracoccaceae bacterium]
MASHEDSEMLITEGLPEHLAGHERTVTSVRRFEHGGHQVAIEAHYRVLINGIARELHFSVGKDGKVTTHLLPYKTYSSLVDMVRDVIDNFSESLETGDGGQADA